MFGLTSKVAAWALLALCAVLGGLLVSQYLRANSAEEKLAACTDESHRRGVQIEGQNASIQRAAAAASAAQSESRRLLAEAQAKSATQQGRIDALQRKLRAPSSSKTCDDAVIELREGWKAATP